MSKSEPKNNKKHNNPLITPRNVSETYKDWETLFNTGQAGIDTVSLSIPIDLNTVEQESSVFTNEGFDSYRDSGRIRHKLVGHLKKDYATIRLEVYPEQGLMKLTFNAARVITPKSPILLPPLALAPLVEGIFDDLRDTVMPVFDSVDTPTGELHRDPHWKTMVSITRLDCARNLYIDDPVALKKALVLAKPKYKKLSHLYWDAQGGWTIQSQTKYSGLDRVYDKTAELALADTDESLAGEGTLYRFEAELKGNRLGRFGLKTLDTVTNERVSHALETRWDHLNWAVTIPRPDSFLAAIAHLPIKAQNDIIGYIFRVSQNNTGVYTKNQIRRLNGVAHELGLTVGLPLEEVDVGARQLDLLAGEFVDIEPVHNGDSVGV